MSLRTRLYVNDVRDIKLTESQAHYLFKVLRLKQGEELRCFDGKNGEWKAFLNKENKLESTEILREQATSKRLHVAFCPLKNINISTTIRQLVELGVTDIHPIISERTIVDKVNIEKANLSLIDAVQQSERLDLPTIYNIQKLDSFISKKHFKGDLLFFYEKAEFRQNNINNLLDNCLLIGPEGGFSEEEADLISKQSIVISLGERILKADTAIIAAVSYYNTVTNGW